MGQGALVPAARMLGQVRQLANAIFLPDGSTTQLQPGLESSREAEESCHTVAEVLV